MKDHLELTQENDKLLGGFSVLSTEKLRRINGGVADPNTKCTNNDSRVCNTTNKTTCTNYNGHCADSYNADFCQNKTS